MACNLLPTSLSHRSCHKDEIQGWIFIKTSVHGSSNFSGCAFDKSSFAARSASSFPLISLWLGSQQNVIWFSDELDDECKTVKSIFVSASWHPLYIYKYIIYIYAYHRSTVKAVSAAPSISISDLTTWERQLQDEARAIYVLVFDAPYVSGLTLYWSNCPSNLDVA